jgi:hypothetical protein
MRNRRGSQVVEFALILPIFLILTLGTIDITWFMLQKFTVTDAVASGCRTGALSGIDPETDPAWIARTAILDNLEKTAMLDCALNMCSIEIDETSPYSPKNRQIECRIDASVSPMSGYVPGMPNRMVIISTWPVEIPRSESEDTGI